MRCNQKEEIFCGRRVIVNERVNSVATSQC